MKKLKREDLQDLCGYYTGHGEALSNGESGYYFDPEIKSITIVICDGNAGDYSRIFLTREFLSKLGYIRNIYGETDYIYENSKQKHNDNAKLIQDYFTRRKEND